MKVRLLEDQLAGGVVRVTRLPRKRRIVAWYKDTVLEVSEASGRKFIAAGVAVQVEDAAPAAGAGDGGDGEE